MLDVLPEESVQTAPTGTWVYLSLCRGCHQRRRVFWPCASTSHMTGIVSSMADNLALGQYALVLSSAGALLCFLSGAISSAVMVNYAHRRKMHSEYAIPLLLKPHCSSFLACWAPVFPRLPGCCSYSRHVAVLYHGSAERGDYQTIQGGDQNDAHHRHRDRYRHRAGQAVLQGMLLAPLPNPGFWPTGIGLRFLP